MTTFQEAIVPEDSTTIRGRISAFATASGLKITNWRTGGIGQQILEWTVATAYAFTNVTAKYVRGFGSLDTSVDPGDADPYDTENEGLVPEPGMLSEYGRNVYSTTRIERTFATGSVTFTNAGTVARTFAPYGLTFTWTVNPPVGTTVTYRNAEDSSIYTGGGGTVTVAPGDSIELPVICDIAGSVGSCPSGSVTLTTTLLGCSATNSEPIAGNDREDAESYRARCRAAAARLSLGGPSAVYQYLSNTNLDGTPLYNAASPPTQVGITRTYVSSNSATGAVTCYYASASGAPIAADVTAANANIESYSFAVPDCITFTGAGATETNIPVVGTARIKATTGLDVAEVRAAIVSALTEYWPTIPIGGFDQDGSGNGVLYTRDIEAVAKSGYNGLYNVTVTTPSGSSTAITAGHVATLTTTTSNWTITVVP